MCCFMAQWGSIRLRSSISPALLSRDAAKTHVRGRVAAKNRESKNHEKGALFRVQPSATTETPTVTPPLHVPVGAKDGTPAASSSPDVALGTANGVTAAATSVTGTDPDVETDLVSAVTAPPTAEHTSPFLLHLHRRVADMAVDPALGATTLAHTADDTSQGRKRNNASGNDDDADASVATAGDAANAATAAATPVSLPSKRRRHVGPTEAVRLRQRQQARTPRSARPGHG